jgi:hypothetical protein
MVRKHVAVTLPGLLLVTALLLPSVAEAQVGPEGQYSRIISVNPIALVILGSISVEYEHAFDVNNSWGVSASYHEWSDWTYAALDGKFRYYLQGRALEGLSVGFLVGASRGRDDESDDSGTAVAVGFMVEHQWLLGDDERLAVTVGGGGKRLAYVDHLPGAPRGLPTIRLSLGWAF